MVQMINNNATKFNNIAIESSDDDLNDRAEVGLDELLNGRKSLAR